jgi:hypothetical protein
MGHILGPVTEGGPSRALKGLEDDDQGKRLWRILASRGIVEARNAQTRPFSLFSAFFCDCRASRCRQRWIPTQTLIIVFTVLEPPRFALLPQSLPPLGEYYKPAQEAKQKVPETTDSEPPRKKRFIFRY